MSDVGGREVADGGNLDGEAPDGEGPFGWRGRVGRTYRSLLDEYKLRLPGIVRFIRH